MEEDSFEGLVEALADIDKQRKKTETQRNILCDTYTVLPRVYEPIEEVEARVFGYNY